MHSLSERDPEFVNEIGSKRFRIFDQISLKVLGSLEITRSSHACASCERPEIGKKNRKTGPPTESLSIMNIFRFGRPRKVKVVKASVTVGSISAAPSGLAFLPEKREVSAGSFSRTAAGNRA